MINSKENDENMDADQQQLVEAFQALIEAGRSQKPLYAEKVLEIARLDREGELTEIYKQLGVQSLDEFLTNNNLILLKKDLQALGKTDFD